MKITKYEHACLDIEEGGQRLIIDPGVFSDSLKNFSNIFAVVVTHSHPDHLDPEKLVAITRDNPSSVIYTVQTVADQLGNGFPLKVVTTGDNAKIGNFSLDFYGGEHAFIHSTYPRTMNVGVMVNKKLYYPGDSFDQPNQPVEVLAVPSSAPWMRVGESMDFISAIQPKRVFPTHNAILSELGADIHNTMLESAARQAGAEYILLAPSASLTV